MLEPMELPHSAECERAVLGAALLSPEELARVTDTLTDEDFYLDRNRLIFSALATLAKDHGSADVLQVRDLLAQQARLEDAGGLAYLVELDAMLPALSSMDVYLETLRDRATRRRMLDFALEVRRKAHGPDGDATAILAGLRQRLESLAVGATTANEDPPGFDVTLAEIEGDLARESGSPTGLPSGFVDLDKRTLGFGPGQLWIIAGLTGSGKSALAAEIAGHVAIVRRRRVGFVSLEMTASEVGLRIVSRWADVDHSKIRGNYLGGEDRARVRVAMTDLRDAPLWIDDTATASVPDLRARCKRLAAGGKGVELLVVDYLQLMRPSPPRESREREVAEMARGLKVLAMDLEIPILCLSQLNREATRRDRPRLADLRESGAIEQDANGVIFVWRESQTSRETELILAKNRSGTCGTIHLDFEPDRLRFRSVDRRAA